VLGIFKWGGGGIQFTQLRSGDPVSAAACEASHNIWSVFTNLTNLSHNSSSVLAMQQKTEWFKQQNAAAM
jgi:hypothetical protein